MTTLTGIIANVKNGKYSIVQKMPVKDFKLKLNANAAWRIGIDPASRYTGLAIMDVEKNFVILLDVKRDTIANKEEYYNDLYYLIKRLVTGITFDRVVSEKPFTGGFSRASDVLIALMGKIEEWVASIPELAASDFQLINPNVWKSRVIDKSKGKGRFNMKGAIAEDLCDAFPVLRPYFELGIGGDFDSFDALGILLGYDLYAYTDDGRKRISGTKEKTHKSFVGYQWVNSDEIGPDFAQKTLGLMAQYLKPEILEYNEDYSFAENVMMATTNNDAVISIVPDKLLQQFQWKFGIDVSDKSRCLIMFAFRCGHFSLSEMDYLRSQFDMQEEFGGV